MKIQRVSVNSLLFDSSNANTHNEKSINALKSSLSKFGQQKIIVVDADNVVICGNGTLEAAKSLGWENIYINRTHLRGPEALAYAIADNKIATKSEFNLELLGSHLEGLKADGWDIGELGFDIEDLDMLDVELPTIEDPPEEKLKCSLCGK